MWQDISTAPKDGNILVLLGNGEIFRAQRSSDGWWTASDIGVLNPTHWQPLPAPPTTPQPDVVERVAKAIWEKLFGGRGVSWVDANTLEALSPESQWDKAIADCYTAARAAIAAMGGDDLRAENQKLRKALEKMRSHFHSYASDVGQFTNELYEAGLGEITEIAEDALDKADDIARQALAQKERPTDE